MKKFEDIKTICNLGCGTMGFGTAIAFAKSGYEVNMFGRKDASIERAMKNIHFTLDVMKANDLLTEEEEKGLLSRIHGVAGIGHGLQHVVLGDDRPVGELPSIT